MPARVLQTGERPFCLRRDSWSLKSRNDNSETINKNKEGQGLMMVSISFEVYKYTYVSAFATNGVNGISHQG